LAGALFWFWYRVGLNNEGLDLTIKALASPSAVNFKDARARALNTAGFLQCLQGDTASARKSLEEALSILRESDDETSLAWTMQILGLVFANDQEYDLADAAMNEGLTLARKMVDVNANNFLFFYGDVDLLRGDTTRARRIYEESATMLQAVGNKGFLAYPLRRLGYLALEQNDTANARKYFLDSLKYNQETGDKPGITACLVSFAAMALHLKKTLIAARLFGVVENRLDSLSVNLLHTDQIELGRIRSQLLICLEKALFTAACTDGWEMSEDQSIAMARELFEIETVGSTNQ
jgi:tetratricopeptide (TPR) repeat protein